MRFGKTLRQSMHGPWREKYIDYAKLKSLLREDVPEDDDQPWTEDDENRFCEEIFNVQLEKVAQFQEEEVQSLRERIDEAFERLKDLPVIEDGKSPDDATIERLQELESDLDRVTNEVKELKKYSNLNYTGFLKIVKKHDRKRGDRYKIRPIMQMSLSRRPFNSEHAYAPLLNKLSLIYFAVREHLEQHTETRALDVDQAETHNGEKYTAYKFWVHPENLLEVKVYILRQLPALVYSEHSIGELDGNKDPTITSLYFDNAKFELYDKKVDRDAEASSLRLRWYGHLSAHPDIFVEQKLVRLDGTSEERKFTIKEKYIKPFVDGDYTMEKSVQKMERQGRSHDEIEEFKSTVEALQQFIKEYKIEPVLRANYIRAAFQRPGDDRVRIAIDTSIAFIREDTLDRSRPCRDPSQWHRTDIDNNNISYPFGSINQSEVSRFPYAVLEIKLKEHGSRRAPTWVEELMASHLVYPSPRFSKFVHGTASLFEDYVNRLPFWLSDLTTDIRKDPQVAFEEEERRRAQQAENEQVVGSFLGTRINSYKPSRSSPVVKSHLADRTLAEGNMVATPQSGSKTADTAPGRAGTDERGDIGIPCGDGEPDRRDYGTLSSVFPGFSLSRYAKAKRVRGTLLPEGVVEPTEWIKNSGPLQIEPKVWLANERTFLKWQHICILLGSLSISLYTAAGQDTIAELAGITYVAIAVFAGGWGYFMHQKRRIMIKQRSGKDFDNMLGPIIISVAMMVALILNFVYAVSFTETDV